MSNLLSKLWPGLSLALITLLLFLLLRGGCGNPAPAIADTTKISMDALRRGYDSARGVDTPIIVRLTWKSDSLASAIDTLQGDLVHANENLQARAGDLGRTMEALDQARAARDTAARLLHGDTLEAEVKSGIPAVEGYTHLTDSLVKACVARGQVQDSIISRLRGLNLVANTTISRQRFYYEILHKDDVYKTAELKFYKPVAIGGVAVVAAIIVLKFIAH